MGKIWGKVVWVVFRIQYNEDTHWQMPQFHFHDAYELILVVEGQGEMSIGSQTYAMEPGTVMAIDNGVIHRSQVGEGITYGRYVLKLPPEYVAKLSTAQTDLRALFACSSFLLTEQQRLEVEALCKCAMESGTGYGADLLRQNALVALLVQLSLWAGQAKPTTTYHTPDLDRVTPIMDYITAHATEPLSLDEIAAQFYVTKQHLCYSFKKATGLSVNQYVTAQRLWLACGHLRAGLPVQLSGERAGFGNNSHFIRTFKSAFGVSPGQYKASYQGAIFAGHL